LVSTFVAENKVVWVNAVRLESDMYNVSSGRIDTLAPSTSTTHGAAVFRVIVQVDSVHRFRDGRVPMARPINLALHQRHTYSVDD